MKVKVSNMSGNSGGEVPNQFIIETSEGVYFQSYQSVIAFKPFGVDKKIQLDEEHWDYSRTTLRYLNQFLGTAGKRDIERRIAEERYEITTLN